MLRDMRYILFTLIMLWSACGDPPLGSPPLALLNAPTYCDLGATIEIDGSHSTDPDDDIVRYRFYIADGTSAVEANEPILLYSCRTPGLIEMMLEVVDSQGNASYSRLYVSVRR